MTSPNQNVCIYLLSPFIESKDPLLSQIFQIKDLVLYLLSYESLSSLLSSQGPYILLVDARFDEETLMMLQTHPVLKKAQATGLIFAPEKANIRLLSQWYNLAGYFYKTNDMADFTDALGKMLDGHNCLSKSLLIELFKHWQQLNHQQNTQMIKAKLALTHREREILVHLQVGQSNLDIADSLFVSEHTIKSHLYRIFKKLNVSNRRQAINWAQLYL